MLKKSAFREIRTSLGRYIAIVAIIALGVGFFAGLRVTKSAMVKTADLYINEHGLFDYRLLSTVGYDADDEAAFAALDGVRAAEGSFSADFLVQTENGSDTVFRVHSMMQTINTLSLVAGALPTQDNECVVDALYFDERAIGSTLRISPENDEDTRDLFRYTEYRIVGIVNSVYYLNHERGSTTLGSGSLSGFMYLPYGGFDTDYFTDLFLLLDESGTIYSDAYDTAIDAYTSTAEDAAQERAEIRYRKLITDAEQEIADGQKELADGRAEYETEKAKAERELRDAEEKLRDGAREIAENEEKLADAKRELSAAKSDLVDGWEAYQDGISEYETQRADAEAELDAAERNLIDLRRQVNSGFAELGRADIDSAEAELSKAQEQMALIEDAYDMAESAIASGELSAADLAELSDVFSEYGYTLPAGVREISDEEFNAIFKLLGSRLRQAQRELATAEAQLAEAREQESELYRAQAEIDRGFNELRKARAEAEQEFLKAEAELADAEAQLIDGARELADAETEIADGEQALADAKAELSDGWQEYRDARAEVDEKLADARQELTDGELELADARQKLADLKEPDVYVLDRSTNVGYVCFESDSDIMEAVSRVFPVFFFFVAALVCITTMTRMVDEQRTQIGVLKALGYTNLAIMSKFMLYSGSASLIGCLAGFIGGSIVFPKVLWSVYDIMYGFADIVLIFDNRLALVMILAFMTCALGATWFACRSELADVPAELMRPKTPKSGKRVFLERLPFLWNRMKFLHKVSIRNIFRYKKRLVMMILGISGCTALLITGFGIRDSIKNVADYQFNEISLYDYSITLTNGADEEIKTTISEAGGTIDKVLFLHESTIDLLGENETKSVNIVASDEDISAFFDLHDENGRIAYPKPGEVVICDALADRLHINVGDTVTLRTSDMKSLNVKVSAVFRNYVFYYVFINAETCLDQWGSVPAYKTGYVNVTEGADARVSAAKVLDVDGVAGVSVVADLRERVVNMMSSLDYIVLLIVFCAAMLALIVLYNLTNINITERIREIATIKVLGFYANETASYVFRENVLLTAMGALFGVLLGKLLHLYVMNQIKIDMISFDIRIEPLSMLFSIGLTFFFTIGINLLMRIKLDQVNMAESLKSIE